MDLVAEVIAAAAEAPAKSVNLWGALGCAVAYSASLLATLDAFADLILARDDSPAGRLTPGVGLKFGSKIAAAAIAVVSAGIVLALDANWFAFTALTIAFLVVVLVGIAVMIGHVRNAERAAAKTAAKTAGAPPVTPPAAGAPAGTGTG
ncbi:MAG: hypothetical protein GX539_15380 [Candidatus Cloacimonetes bacterium]|nr:hypothetical protein [Candidatus Cloacimonadota bacterium]